MSDDDLKKIGNIIDERLDKRLDQKLEPMKKDLNELKAEINDPETGLKALNGKVEDIQAELSDVHKLAASTMIWLNRKNSKEEKISTKSANI